MKTKNTAERNRPEQLLKPEDVARMLNVNRATLNRWVGEGRIPAVQIGPGARRYRRADIESWIERCAEQARGGGQA